MGEWLRLEGNDQLRSSIPSISVEKPSNRIGAGAIREDIDHGRRTKRARTDTSDGGIAKTVEESNAKGRRTHEGNGTQQRRASVGGDGSGTELASGKEAISAAHAPHWDSRAKDQHPMSKIESNLHHHSNFDDGKETEQSESTPKSYRGVKANGKRWQARAWKDGKYMHIGLLPTQDEAAAAVEKFFLTGEKSLQGHKVAPSGYRGVSIARSGWRARLKRKGKEHHLGHFETVEEAAQAVKHFEEEEKAAAMRKK